VPVESQQIVAKVWNFAHILCDDGPASKSFTSKGDGCCSASHPVQSTQATKGPTSGSLPMSQAPPPEHFPPPKQRRRRRALAGVLAVLLLLAGACLYLYHLDLAERDLQAARAEVDRKEPGGWRLQEREAQRAAVPDEQNAALVVLAAKRRMPPSALLRSPLNGRIEAMPLAAPADRAVLEEVRRELERVFGALAE